MNYLDKVRGLRADVDRIGEKLDRLVSAHVKLAGRLNDDIANLYRLLERQRALPDRHLVQRFQGTNHIRREAATIQRWQEPVETRTKLEKLGGQNLAGKPQHENGFASETAERTGMSKSAVNQAIARPEKIAPDVLEAVTDMPDHNRGVELDALARLSPASQREALSQVKRGDARDFRHAAKCMYPRSLPREGVALEEQRAWQAREAQRTEVFYVEQALEEMKALTLTPEKLLDICWDQTRRKFIEGLHAIEVSVDWLLEFRDELKRRERAGEGARHAEGQSELY